MRAVFVNKAGLALKQVCVGPAFVGQNAVNEIGTCAGQAKFFLTAVSLIKETISLLLLIARNLAKIGVSVYAQSGFAI